MNGRPSLSHLIIDACVDVSRLLFLSFVRLYRCWITEGRFLQYQKNASKSMQSLILESMKRQYLKSKVGHLDNKLYFVNREIA